MIFDGDATMEEREWKIEVIPINDSMHQAM